MNIFAALGGFLFLMVALIVVAAVILSPILVPRYLRARRAERTREAAMLASLKATRTSVASC